MDTTQVRYFLSAVEMGNFTIAAANNNISQSSFSKKIMALEDELGVNLFIRGKRSLTLSPAGQFFFEYAKKFEADFFNMCIDLRRFNHSPTEAVRIASIPVIHSYHLASVFSEFRLLFPDIPLDIIELSESTFVYDSLRRGECDFAITRMDFLSEEQFNLIPLIQDELVVLLPIHHRLASYDVISVAQLCNEKMSLPVKNTDFYKICEMACLKGGFTPKPYLTISGQSALIDMLQTDSFVAFGMRRIVDSGSLHNLKIVSLSERILSTTALVCYRNRAMTSSMKQFWIYMQNRWNE